MQTGTILKHTETIRAQLATQFADDPKGELDCWVATAQQREAMVVQVYNAMNLERRVPDQSIVEAPIIDLVRKTIGSIWAQETSHAALMAALRRVEEPARLDIAGTQGTVEGLMTSWATSNGVLGTVARGAMGTARLFRAAPEFTAQLGVMSLADFFRFSEELELTAGNGYRRIVELLDQLEKSGDLAVYGVLAQYEFATTLAEERFHEAVFKRLRSWLKKGDTELDAIVQTKALAAIRELAEQHLRVSRVWGLPSKSGDDKNFLESEGEALISDGGLGTLFEQYEIPFRVAARPAAR